MWLSLTEAYLFHHFLGRAPKFRKSAIDCFLCGFTINLPSFLCRVLSPHPAPPKRALVCLRGRTTKRTRDAPPPLPPSRFLPFGVLTINDDMTCRYVREEDGFYRLFGLFGLNTFVCARQRVAGEDEPMYLLYGWRAGRIHEHFHYLRHTLWKS